MNKAELIEAAAERLAGQGKMHITKTQVAATLDALLGAAQETLAAGGEVKLTGFGSFKVAARDARPGTNPKTGQAITIAAHKAVKFTPGKELKAAVNGDM